MTGIAIATQSTMISRVGGIIGDVRTGILTNTMGGIAAGSLMLVWFLREGPQVWKIPPVVIGITALAGILGVFIGFIQAIAGPDTPEPTIANVD